jgi:dual-specificity kinase
MAPGAGRGDSMADNRKRSSPPGRGRSPPAKRRGGGGVASDGGSSSCDKATEEEERAERHYMVRIGDKFDDGRYTVRAELGKGTFGRVVEMWDEKMRITVAVKVVRSISKYRDEAKIEAEILREVQDRIPDAGAGGLRAVPICRLLGTFVHRGHYCLALEKLGSSLYDTLRRRRRRLQAAGSKEGVGQFFSLRRIQAIAADCFAALAHLHWVGLTHTDLKLE